MEYKTLGNSVLNVSRIGFGCMSLAKEDTDNQALLRTAFDLGINLFDTADLYDKGVNEIVVGRSLKEVRDKVYIATKVGNQWRSDSSGWDWNPTKDYILEAVEKSLQRLQTDYIDLYQLHGGTINDPFEEVLEAFELLKEQGKIRYYGISSIRPNVIDHWLNHASLTSNMMQYSLLDRRPEEQSFRWAEAHKMGILARGSLAKGLLIDKPVTGYLNYSDDEVQQVRDAIQKLSSHRTQAQTALRFALNHSAVTSAITGIRTKEQLVEVTDTFSKPGFDAEEYEYLQSILEPNTYEGNRVG